MGPPMWPRPRKAMVPVTGTPASDIVLLLVLPLVLLLRSELQFAAAQRGEVGLDVRPGDLGEGGGLPAGIAVLVHHLGADAFAEVRAVEEAQADAVLLLQRLLQAQAADAAQGFQRHLDRRRRLGLDGVRGCGGLPASLPTEGPQPAQDFPG